MIKQLNVVRCMKSIIRMKEVFIILMKQERGDYLLWQNWNLCIRYRIQIK